ncbi:MAG TPA: hypothetical protein VFH99_03975 [Candidatus Saccharimonadales bacterium]|nr:hypothetical protein [Candidatus Saccharimonadales bacterium]
MAANTDKTSDSQAAPGAATESSSPANSSGQNRKLPNFRSKLVIKTILGLALLVVVILVGWHFYNDSRNVVIGNTTITPKQVNELSDELAQYTKKNKNVSFGNTHKTARDTLILNAALKDEAKRLHATIGQADIDKVQANQYKTYGGKDKYQGFADYQGIGKFTQLNAENNAYKAKLEDKLIAKKDLLVAGIIYDTPYVNNSTNPTPMALRQQALATVQKKFLPLFQQNKSDQTIIAQADIGPGKRISTGSKGTYFNSMPSVAFYAKGCTTASPCFNDVKAKPLSGLPDPVSTQKEVDKLTTIGQSTGVFNSEAGFVGVLRLVGKTSGNYGSWDQFLQHYEDKYAKGRLLGSILLSGDQSIYKAVRYLTNHLAVINDHLDALVWQKASADPSCTDNSAHLVNLNIHAYNQNGGNLSGATVTETRPNAQCPNSGGRYIDSQTGANHGPNGGSTNSSGQLSFNDNCYNSPPDWSQSGPSGYTLGWVHVYDVDGDDATMVVGQNFNGTITDQNAIGKAITDSGIWNNGVLNTAGSLTIELHYNQTPTTWTLTSTSTVDGVQGTIRAAPGSHHTFKHTIHNNGPSTATYNWAIKDGTGSGYSGTGINSGGNINVNNDSNGPNGYTKGYTVPGSAKNGDKYCMRIDYSHADGPTDGSNSNSSPACIIVDNGHTQPPSPAFGCNNVTVPHTDGYITYTTISGTDSDGTYETDPGGPDLNLNMTPTHKDVSITTDVWHNVNAGTGNPPNWQELPGNPQTPIVYHCLHASCSGGWVDGDGPWDGSYNPDGSQHHIVQAGHSFTAYVNVKNDNTATVAQPIQSSVGDTHFSLTEPPDQYRSDLRTHNTDFGLDVGEEETKKIDDFAPNGNTNQIRSMTLQFYPDYYGSDRLDDGTNCSITFNIYQHFDASLPPPKSDPEPTKEHPYQGVDYATYINVKNDLSHAVNIPTSSEFYKLAAVGGKTTIASSTGGTYGIYPPYPSSPGGTPTTTLFGHYNIAAGSYQAGDEYCAHIHADYTTGYVGPDNGVVAAANPADNYTCPRIANEPYFHVYNSDISAGGDFGQCSKDGGTLAGYSDISDPPGATRGSSTQLSALALLKITGVASAQSPGNINGSPTKLSFANDPNEVQVDSTGNESPALGGYIGGPNNQDNACRTLTNETAPTGAPTNTSSNPVINDIGTLSGSHLAPKNNPSDPDVYLNSQVYDDGTDNTKLTIKGGTLPSSINTNVSIFVKGDVYISNNITYGNGWGAGTAPSFVVHATGNIYVAPGVKQLAGVYIAQEKSDGTKGKIYTCADTVNHFSPMSAANLYNGCKNQLVVTGNFVAKQINLMRTLGSLRDEEPNAAVPARLGSTAVPFHRYYCGGLVRPGYHYYQADSTPPRPSKQPIGCGDEGANGYILPTQTEGSVPLYYTTPTSLTRQNSYYTTNYSQAVHNIGIPSGSDVACFTPAATCNPVIVGYVQTSPKQDTTPLYGLYGTDSQTYFYTTSKAEHDSTLSAIQSAGVDHGWSLGIVAYVYTKAHVGGSPAVGLTAPAAPHCSNLGSQSIASTCAGEIFEYSPALYLSSPADQPPGGGSLQFQSITSLPPVL